MAGGLVDGLLRQIGAAHVGDRRPVDEVAARRRARPRKSQARFARPGAQRGEPIGAKWVVKQDLPAWRAPASSTATKGEPASPARGTASSSAQNFPSLAVASRTTGARRSAGPGRSFQSRCGKCVIEIEALVAMDRRRLAATAGRRVRSARPGPSSRRRVWRRRYGRRCGRPGADSRSRTARRSWRDS